MKQIKNLFRQTKKIISLAMLFCTIFTVPVFANGNKNNNNVDTSAITQPINNLATLFTAIIAAIGVIVLAKGIFEVASAYNQQDTAGVSQGLKGIVSGLLMAFIGTVITIMGL